MSWWGSFEVKYFLFYHLDVIVFFKVWQDEKLTNKQTNKQQLNTKQKQIRISDQPFSEQFCVVLGGFLEALVVVHIHILKE